jgi:hypothetical protein
MGYAYVGALGALSSTSVKAMQTAANAMLVPQGYKPINVDGIVGPLTCGAVTETAKFDGGAFLAQSKAQGLTCTSSTPPTRVAGASAVVPQNQVIDLDAPTPAPTPAASSSILSSITPTTMVIAGGLVAGIIVLVYASKKKNKPRTAAA